MPNHKRPAGQTEAEYARAAWDWAQEPAREGGFDTQVTQRPAAQVGVWKVTVRLLHVVDGKPAGIVAQVHGQWPNSQHVDYWAYVWSLQFQLAELVVQSAEQALGAA